MKRQPQLLLIAATLGLSWLLMQTVHEAGHIGAALATGGRVEGVVLHAAALSYTRVTVNPHPLIEVWAGPIVGCTVPLVFWLIAKKLRIRGWYVLQFFAGFCLIANGAYIAFGSFGRIGDAGDLLRHGSPIWLLWLFGLTTIPLGLWLWDGLGPHFGLGPNAQPADHGVIYCVMMLLIVVMAVEMTFSPTTLS